MGHAGFEPATLGLKVRLNKLKVAAPDRMTLQTGRCHTATSRGETHRSDTSPYAHTFARPPPEEATASPGSVALRPLMEAGPMPQRASRLARPLLASAFEKTVSRLAHGA